ncbi:MULTISPECIES: autotransporter outer membrane beta-barrel domain-containing protein [unclassified Bartonella]|uniref:autotransporter outer membrane beta-barrel domain-containing protein n=1 Tax=unclassified Bartonella TaxID=2645622 RepID=UPI000999ECC5|nr:MULTISPECIES: autotransporter outer membrane beta-barrel domain-containing protein [unclassified Bartonella]AQX27737.1 outer membrane autotransporter barrel domain-containing protein [Bartonella sp. JB15]AQX29019.1 outer membrane autotransporter barrel domain-containing protein [Bartonella sp. JB63]
MRATFIIKLSLKGIFLLFSITNAHSIEQFFNNENFAFHSRDIPIESIIDSSALNREKSESKYVGILANKIGKADFTGVNITADSFGVVPYAGSRVYIKNSTIRVTNPLGYGIYFRHKLTPNDLDPPSQVHLNNTTISSPYIGISSKGPGIVILKNSQIYSDILTSQPTTNTAYQQYNYAEMLRIDADGSTLQGQSKVENSQYMFLTLKNGSKWIIPASSNSEERRQESTIHMLHLYDSAIVFDKNVSGGYQTLSIQIPQGKSISQYFTAGDARVYFNVSSVDSDKLIIKTDVQGVTKIYINHVKDPRDNTDVKHIGIREYVSPSKEGISLIEVYGKATENSFKLAHGYTTVGGFPYKNVLKRIPVYDVVSEPLTNRRFNWHFRLQNEYIDSQSQVRSLVPRMASYLVMPNALFSSGISDINNQNKVLADMRERLVSSKKKGSLFLSSYGNVANFSSIRNPLQYGYGADTVYAALQTGAVLGSFENENIITNFGLLGTYGKVSFTPKDMEGSAKSSLDKWSVSAFGSVQHDNNLYMNALLSYGIVKGHIKTAVIDNVAEIDDTKMFSVSGTVGQKLATGVENVSFEPQAQLIYQSVMFNNILDIDKLQVNMKDPNQWLARVGGRLTKTTVVEKDSVVSFYGKLNVMKTLSASDTIEVGDTFHLDSMGSAIEGGLGINVQLTKKILFHGDASYQKRLSKTGVSGASFSGRLHYRF